MNSSIETVIVFSDAATSSKANLAIGAFLFLNQSNMKEYTDYSNQDLMTALKKLVVYKKYPSHKSTWAEIKTAIDALYTLQQNHSSPQIEIYTDCQSLCDLLGHRREKLEKNNFMTQSGKLHQNTILYKALFAIADKFQINILKIKGHDRSAHRFTVQSRIFAVLDKLCRNQLRSIL